MNIWQQFEQFSCIDGCGCEALRDHVIRQPAAFFSSLAYIVMVALLTRHLKRKSFEAKLFLASYFLLGLASLFGHASFTKFSLAVDFSCIMLVLTLGPSLKLLSGVSHSKILGLVSCYFGFLISLMYAIEKWPKVTLSVFLFLYAVIDIFKEMKGKLLKEKDLRLAIAITTVSFGLFLLDEFRFICRPHGLFQWHAVWHVGTAVSLYYFGRWRFSNHLT